MMIGVILVALLLAFLAFRFIMGTIKWVAICAVLVLAYVVGHAAGAF